MNFITKRIKSLWKTLSRVFRKRKSGVFSNDDMAAKRLEACRACEFFRESGMCDICGCIMSVKVKFKAAKCALEDEGKEGKWPN